jgi:DNA replication protein DnaC
VTISEQSQNGRLREALVYYLRSDLPIVDEASCLSCGQDAANVLCHLVNERHLRQRSMLLTTSKPLQPSGQVLHDEDLAEALSDRILERGRLIHLDGPPLSAKLSRHPRMAQVNRTK